MNFPIRIRSALRAAGIHTLCSLFVAALSAALVFGLWYPHPYEALSGGRELFLLVVAVDVMCGPLLTLVLFNPLKPRAELWRDLFFVALIQLAALGYGLWTVWQARPLFLVQEVDRFKVVMAPSLIDNEVAALPASIRPSMWRGPITVAIRPPKDLKEKNAVLFDSIEGGRDYAERPDFYLPYDGDAALVALKRAKTLELFLQKYPEQWANATPFADKLGTTPDKLMYLPVIARQDWVAILDGKAMIVGFLKGDGF
jgi:hypothetical protein